MENKLVLTNDQLANYLDLFGAKDLLKEEKLQFIEICKMNGLNPFKREIHIVAYGSGTYRKCAIIVGYETYIKRAEESGRLDGWHTTIEQCKTVRVDVKGNISFIDDIQATVTIYRKDFVNPFLHSVKLSEYLKKTKDGSITEFWLRPESQLKKVAISQGFRLCFNEVLGGMPYTREESVETMDITEQQQKDDLKDTLPALNTPTAPKQEIKPETKKTGEKPELLPNSTSWNSAIFLLKEEIEINKGKDGTNVTAKIIEKIRKKYILSEENAGLLICESWSGFTNNEFENETIK